MRITKEESRVLLAKIFYCKEQGMNDDWMEGYLIEQIEILSKFRQHDVSGSVCDCMKNLYTEGIYIKCRKCGATINIQEQTVH
jgi:hypothetical protein